MNKNGNKKAICFFALEYVPKRVVMISRLLANILILSLLGIFVSCEKRNDSGNFLEFKEKIDYAHRLQKVYSKMEIQESDLSSLVEKWYIGLKSTYFDGKLNPLSEYKRRPEYLKIIENKYFAKEFVIKLIRKEKEPLFCLYQLLYDMNDWNIDELDDIDEPKQFILEKIELIP